jgi:hypothetical protein
LTTYKAPPQCQATRQDGAMLLAERGVAER